MHSQYDRLPVRCAYDPQTDTIRPVGSDGLAPGEQAFSLEQVTCHLEARVGKLSAICGTVPTTERQARPGGGIVKPRAIA
jgi:hypothetical protein